MSKSMVDNIAVRFKNVLKKSESLSEVNEDDAVADAAQVEPISLALRIQSLIRDLPLPSNTRDLSSNFPQDGEPPPSSHIQDSKFIRMLRNASIMNGTRNINSGRPSIWSILERLGTSKREEAPAENNAQPYPLHDDEDVPDEISDSSSIMVYSPLLPARDSLVELADSEIIVEEEETDGPEPEPESQPPIPGWSWADVMPTFNWFTQPPPKSPLLDDNGQPLTPRTRERRLRARASRTWIPSKYKLSIQCMWWGYRMFLPPPVLAVLNDRQLEAAKRTAMITTALTWFFNNLPINSFPPPLRPTLLLVQHIAPYLGYIGTFISWSWSTIVSYDQGYGVVLTATWLLPIALIPGTWFERDWPTSPAPPQSPVLSPDPSLQAIPSSPLPRDSSSLPAIPITSPSESLTPVSAPQSTLPPTQIPTASDSLSSAGPASVSPDPDPTSTTPNSSPAISFVTAPNSPLPMSPQRIPTGLASLVAKSPIIRIRRSLKSKPNSAHISLRSPGPGPSPLSQPPSQQELNTDVAAYPSPTSTNPVPAANFPSQVASPLVTQHQPSDTYPSPQAHPNDLRLLQSPLWQCSPLPPEHSPHPALLTETEMEEPPRAGRKRTRVLDLMKRQVRASGGS